MLPDAKGNPSCRHEEAVKPAIALPVATDLARPVGGVGGHLPAMLRAAMPEAPVHEHRDPRWTEHEVSCHAEPLKGTRADPIPKTKRMYG